MRSRCYCRLAPKRARRRDTAFTLVELLTVIAIISVLASIIVPVTVRVRKEAHKTTAISNLRQCGMALLMYVEDYDGLRDMPSYEVAKKVLQPMPTCDPGDYWRKNCREELEPPMIGSFGYVRGIEKFADQDEWESHLFFTRRQGATILADVFYGDSQLVPVHGQHGDCHWRDTPDCLLPNRVVRFRSDGSVATTKGTEYWLQEHRRADFDWGIIFFHAE